MCAPTEEKGVPEGVEGGQVNTNSVWKREIGRPFDRGRAERRVVSSSRPNPVFSSGSSILVGCVLRFLIFFSLFSTVLYHLPYFLIDILNNLNFPRTLRDIRLFFFRFFVSSMKT